LSVVAGDPRRDPARSRSVNVHEAISPPVLERVIVTDNPVRRSVGPELALRVSIDPLQRWVAARGALLLAIGMVTGLWSGAALSGVVTVTIPRLALAAHLNCLLGCFWLLGFAFTLPMLSYGDKAKQRLARLMMLPTYGNWLITLLASFLGVRGLVFTGERANDVVAALLLAVVVAPALVASFAWAWGFKKRPDPQG
jgi:hydroxylaminobenzene mutase